MLAKDRIYVALDVQEPKQALELVLKLRDKVGSFKIGLELITAMLVSLIVDARSSAFDGLVSIRELFSFLGRKVFWDGKFDDIPNTVAGASKALNPLNIKLFNVHASAGIEAMMAAVANKGNAEVFAVTVLTSIEENNCHLDFGAPSKAKVIEFARNAKLAGCDGVICSPQELIILDQQKELTGLKKVTPGIRSSKDPADDQKRTMTVMEAALWGADGFVIGRPITQAAFSADSADSFALDIYKGLKMRFHKRLFDLGKVKFGAFRLKLHEQNPDAPLSPIYLNIRDLPEELYELAGNLLHELCVREQVRNFDYVIGIPKAGEPIGQAFAKAVDKPFLRIEKIEKDEVRRITSKIIDPFEKKKKVVLIDDLVTGADTKREAIEAVESNGLEVVATFVLYDREQGGLEQLRRDGHVVHAVSSLTEVLDFFVEKKSISESKRTEVLAYTAANRN